jgi:hypothetical protein
MVPPSITVFNPSSPTAWSSSATASSGLNVGIAATGSSRSRKPSYTSA